MSHQNDCVSCKRPKSAAVPGATYVCVGDHSMQITFFMCNRCAIPLGPSQGPITLTKQTAGPRSS